VVVNDPNVFFDVVRVDGNVVGTLQDLVPLGPALHDVSLRIGNDDAVFPLRVNANFAKPPVCGSAGSGARGAATRKRRSRRVTPGQAADGECNTRAEFRYQLRWGTFD